MTEDQALELILGDAKERPMAFLALLARRVIALPDGVTLLCDVLEDFAGQLHAEADELRTMKDRSAEIIPLNP